MFTQALSNASNKLQVVVLVNVDKIDLRNRVQHIGQDAKVEGATLFRANILCLIFAQTRIICDFDDLSFTSSAYPYHGPLNRRTT